MQPRVIFFRSLNELYKQENIMISLIVQVWYGLLFNYTQSKFLIILSRLSHQRKEIFTFALSRKCQQLSALKV